MQPHPKLLPTILLTAAAHLPAAPAVGQQYASHAVPGDARVPGQVTSVLPVEIARIVVHGDTVFYRDGVFFRLAPAGYVVIRAPLGARVPSLPASAVRVSVGEGEYWYDRGTFYAAHQAGFVTVLPPVGCVVPSLPTDVSAIADIDGVLYYLYAGTFYRPILADGRTAYVVADP